MSTTWAWATPQAPPECSAADAWAVIRTFATGVAVVTTGSGPGVRGTTVSSFALAARTPPVISVSLRRGSAALMQLKAEEGFTVNMLAREQAHLAAHFAGPGRPGGLDHPACDAWSHGIVSGPALRGAAGWLECRTELALGVGDHELVLGRVCAAVAGSGIPLVQHRESLW